MAKKKEITSNSEAQTKANKLSIQEFLDIVLGKFEKNPAYSNYYKSTKQTKVVVFENVEVEPTKTVKIENQPKIYGFTFKNTKIGDIELYSCNVIGDITFDEASSGGNVVAYSSQTKGLYVFRQSKIKSIILRSSDINNINITTSIISNVVLDGSSTCKGLTFYDECVTGLIEIGVSGENRENEKDVVDSIKIDRSAKINGINIRYATIGEVWIGNESSISFLESYKSEVGLMIYESKKNIQMLVKESTFGSIELKNTYTVKDSFVQIIESKLSEVLFENFQNLGVITFTNISPILSEKKTSKFAIINSDIGKTQFINADLGKFDIFEFANSKITDSFFAGGSLPQNITIRNGYNQEEQKRIIYGQLKKVFDNRGDNVTAVEFLSKEMNAYLQELRVQSFSLSKWAEILNLLMNRYSSNFGQSWALATVMTIIITFGSYWYYCYLAGFSIGSFNNPLHVNNFWNLLSYAGEFLNPLPKDDTYLKFYPKNTHVNFPRARIFGFLSRIFIAFFVYQAIQAFRKYGKR